MNIPLIIWLRRPEKRGLWAWSIVESTMGAFVAFVIGFTVAVIGGLVVWTARESSDFVWLLPVYIAAVVAECVFLLWLKWRLEAGLHPIAPHLATRQKKWPLVLRPIFAAWWGVHFLTAIAGLFLMERGFSFGDLSLARLAILGGIYLLALFMITHSAMLYLLLAVAAAWPNETLVWRIWKWRIAVDVSVTVLGAIVAWKAGR